ncbi:MAG: isochorismatase family protein [Deltaproteobacteria bacterium]|nr:isochorismatase family protein [Deltaproteobacteria bacterium]
MSRSFCPVQEESALIIVDYQDAILQTFTPKIREQLHKQTKLTIRMAQQLKLPIIVFEQYPEGLGTTNQEIIEVLGDDYQPISKKVFSGAGLISDRLEKIGRRQILIIGIETHICVMQTAVDLLDIGYSLFLLSDVVGSRYTHDWKAGCDLIARAGGWPTTLQTVLYNYLNAAQGPDFKALLPYLKE